MITKEQKTNEDTMNITIQRLDDLYDELKMKISPTELKGIQGVFLGMRNDVALGISALHEQFCEFITQPTTLDSDVEGAIDDIVELCIENDYEWGTGTDFSDKVNEQLNKLRTSFSDKQNYNDTLKDLINGQNLTIDTLQSTLDKVREACDKTFVSFGYGDLQKLILKIMEEEKNENT